MEGKEKVIAEINSLAKKSNEVILATDPDREGEAIAWHIREACDLKHSKRVTFHEITEDAIKEAIKHPREIDMDLKEAQEARRVLDRLVGYDLSGIIWKKVRYGLSAGRVQSPALRIIMEREREIRAFIRVEFGRKRVMRGCGNYGGEQAESRHQSTGESLLHDYLPERNERDSQNRIMVEPGYFEGTVPQLKKGFNVRTR